MTRISGPDQPDAKLPFGAKLLRAKPVFPFFYLAFVWRGKVRHHRWYRPQRRFKRQWQAGNGTMDIKRRQRGRFGNAFGNAIQSRYQRAGRASDGGDNPGSEIGHHGNVASELERVSDPLIRVQKNGLAFNRAIPRPDRLGKFGIAHESCLPSDFTTSPARLNVADEHLEQTQ